MSDARTEFESLVMDQWRTGSMSIHEFARRIHDELVARPALLVRLLGVPRPGPCGATPDFPGRREMLLCCSLDAGHIGFHKDERLGTAWREVGE